MGYKRVLNSAEAEFLAAYAKSAGGKKILTAEIRRDILPQLKLVNGGVTREVSTVYVRLLEMQKRAKAKEAGGVAALAPTAAQKIWLEIKPTILSALALAEKPVNYLAPLEDALAGEQGLAEAIRRSKGADQLRLENEKLKKFLVPARILLRETAGLRAQAAVLTERVKTIREKNGTDLTAFLDELDESGVLEDKK